MYSLKFAHLVHERLPDAEVYNCYIDMRTPGKGYEEFYHRLLDEETNFIQVEEALNFALIESGKAIIATSLILLGGFSVLMISDYNEIFTFGFLLCLVIIITLSVDLLLAPILVTKFFKKYL